MDVAVYDPETLFSVKSGQSGHDFLHCQRSVGSAGQCHQVGLYNLQELQTLFFLKLLEISH